MQHLTARACCAALLFLAADAQRGLDTGLIQPRPVVKVALGTARAQAEAQLAESSQLLDARIAGQQQA